MDNREAIVKINKKLDNYIDQETKAFITKISNKFDMFHDPALGGAGFRETMLLVLSLEAAYNHACRIGKMPKTATRKMFLKAMVANTGLGEKMYNIIAEEWGMQEIKFSEIIPDKDRAATYSALIVLKALEAIKG